MTAPIQLFASDLDGTLIPFAGDRRCCRDFAAAWLALPADRRPLLCYSSGRLTADLRQIAAEVGLPAADYTIGGVGTTIADHDGTILRAYHDHLHPGWDRGLVDTVMRAVPGIEEQPACYQSPFKSSWYLHDADPATINNIRMQLARSELAVAVVYSSQRDLDVLPERADKGNALAWLCRHLGLSPATCIVAGDSGNDAAMFRLGGVHAIAPANAHPDLLAVAPNTLYHSTQSDVSGVLDGLR
ncbi:MAG: HAD-IIB family hydrolase, partial [Planctomycetota bacterium]